MTSQANPLTDRHFGIFQSRDDDATPAEVSRLHDEARHRKTRRDKRETVGYDDFEIGDVVVIACREVSGHTSSNVRFGAAGRMVYALAEVIDKHQLPAGMWSFRGEGTIVVRVCHAEDPVYVGHVLSMGLLDRYGHWWGATVYARDVSHEEYHRRFV